MNVAMFVWTVDGILKAVALAVVVIGFLLIVLLVAWVRLVDWWETRKHRANWGKGRLKY
jgi:hypothetical protein